MLDEALHVLIKIFSNVIFLCYIYWTLYLLFNYHELLKEGNKWNVLQEMMGTCYCGWATTFSYTLSNDTLIENVNYKKLMCEIFSAEQYNNKIVSETVYETSIYFIHLLLSVSFN